MVIINNNMIMSLFSENSIPEGEAVGAATGASVGGTVGAADGVADGVAVLVCG